MDKLRLISRLINFIRLCLPLPVKTCEGRFPHLVIALFVFMSISCAKQGYPPGGMDDKTPSSLIRSTPEHLANGVSRNEPVVFEFDEPMDTKSVEDNLFIVPIPSVWPDYEWKSMDRILVLHFSEPFRDNTTYVISIGSKASDLRRNQLEDSIMLSFSTGAVVENGKITGRIIPRSFRSGEAEKTSGIDIVAYNMDDKELKPDPRKDVPDYMTQSGSDGTFEMVGLSRGLYRLFAIGDNDRNGFYTESYDLIGLAPHDIVLAGTDSIAFAPDIAISERDTSLVRLISIKAPDNRRVELYFDREIVPSSVNIEFDGLDLINWFIPADNPAVISTTTEEQEAGRRYEVIETSVMDRDGNRFEPIGIIPFFNGTDRPDTTVLKVVEWGPKILTQGNEHIRVVFNRVIIMPDTPDNVLSEDSSAGITVKRTAPNECELIPGENWLENMNYLVVFDREKLKGIAGNTLTETGSQLAFRVVSSDTLGYIEGSIEDSTETGKTLYRLLFKNLETETVKELSVQGPMNWSTGPVLPGSYVCRAYKDEDGDGEMFPGSIVPYQEAEHVCAFPDTIKVVSRWTNEDNIFIFK
ncbi:Ig-like domain-containing protein [Candidatus Latescibacterota bacterium]